MGVNIRNRKSRQTKITKRSNKQTTSGRSKFYKRVRITDPIVKASWNPKKTVRENFSSLGLCLNPNDGSKIKNSQQEDSAMAIDEPASQVEVQSSLIAELEKKASCGVKKITKPSQGQLEFVKALVNKHGSDYVAMSKDLNLNFYQHTPKQLQKKCAKYLKEVAGTA
eukprot:Sdes_comp17709_c0_seq1m6979